jgi:pyridoxal 5'-phosphate synthase pdxS subunit
VTVTDVIIVLAAALLVGVYVSWRAGRIDRLHGRVDMARAALDAALLRRSSVAFELASSAILDPATSVLLAGAVHGVLDGNRPRDLAESDLTRALRAAFSQPGFRDSLSGKDAADELLAEVEAAAHQVFLARKFYNDAVSATLVARRRPLARALRLAGKAGLPEYFEMDDSLVAKALPARYRAMAANRWPGQAHPGSGPGHTMDYAGRSPRLQREVIVSTESVTGTARVKRGMADMLKGGVIMDVVTPDQAKIAEDAGAVAVMALERVPADIRAQGGVARMSDPDMIDGIIAGVSIPVMAKCRIGHFAEAQVLQAIGVDYIDESEVLTPADEANHVDKWKFTVPFVCGATNLGEALRRIVEGAAMIRSKGEAGTGNVVEATRHMRSIRSEISRLSGLPPEELYSAAKELGAPYELVAEVAAAGRLPVVLFTAGGIATPADAALMMQLGAEGVFVGSGIFKSGDPARRAAAIVKATTFHDDPDVVAKVSRGLGEAMVGINLDELPAEQHYASRGW